MTGSVDAYSKLADSLPPAILQTTAIRLAPKIIYASPNLNLLARAILQIVNLKQQDGHAEARPHGQVFQALVDKDTTTATMLLGHSPRPPRKGLSVLLTNSTGSLGSYIFDIFPAVSMTSNIYTVHRGPESETIQSRLNTTEGFRRNWKRHRSDIAKNDL